MSSFGLVFSSSSAGTLIGSLILGSMADRFGRKRVLIASVFVLGVFSFVTPYCGSLTELLIVRFIVGLGLGGAAANAVTLASEYLPTSKKVSVVAMLWGAYPTGTACAGLISSFVLSHYPWYYVFSICGILTLAVCAVLPTLLPESLGFLAMRNSASDSKRIGSIMKKLAPDIAIDSTTSFTVNDKKMTGMSVKHLFTEGRAAVTVLLFIACFCAFPILVCAQWVPGFLRKGGMSAALVGYAIALHSIGSIAGSAYAGYINRRGIGIFMMITITGLLAAVFTGGMGYATVNFIAIAITITLSGFFGSAAQSSTLGLVARTFPIAIRGTGVGWSIGMGRLGAVVYPLAMSAVLGLGYGAGEAFLTLFVFGIVGVGSIQLLRVRLSKVQKKSVDTVAS